MAGLILLTGHPGVLPISSFHLLSIGFFQFVEDSYPSPRIRKNIPLWILIGLMFQLKLSQKNSFYKLPGILKSGAILTRTSFNIGKVEGGFNKRNKHPRGKGEIVNHRYF